MSGRLVLSYVLDVSTSLVPVSGVLRRAGGPRQRGPDAGRLPGAALFYPQGSEDCIVAETDERGRFVAMLEPGRTYLMTGRSDRLVGGRWARETLMVPENGVADLVVACSVR